MMVAEWGRGPAVGPGVRGSRNQCMRHQEALSQKVGMAVGWESGVKASGGLERPP